MLLFLRTLVWLSASTAAAHNQLQLQRQRIQRPLLWPPQAPAFTCTDRQTGRHTRTHTHTPHTPLKIIEFLTQDRDSRSKSLQEETSSGPE